MNINDKDINSLKAYMDFLAKNQTKWKDRERRRKAMIDKMKIGYFKKTKKNK